MKIYKFQIAVMVFSLVVVVMGSSPQPPVPRPQVSSSPQPLAPSPDSLFALANTLYKEGRYQEALDKYIGIYQSGFVNGSLLYNIGNCYYKLPTQDIGRVILFYERAAKFLKNDPDLQANLALANLGVVDKITPQSKFFIVKALEFLYGTFGRTGWLWITLGIFALAVLLFASWIVSRSRLFRMFAIRAAFTFGILFIISGAILRGASRFERHNIEALILADKVDALSAPNEEEGVDVFSIHKGTKVQIDQTTGEWVEIILADGKVGWIREGVFEKI
jgi:tetratricopeptide (TPR) repeat protein